MSMGRKATTQVAQQRAARQRRAWGIERRRRPSAWRGKSAWISGAKFTIISGRS
jgi:hypothetical protein